MESQVRHGGLIGRMALAYGLITAEQLAWCVQFQGRQVEPIRIGEILIHYGYLTQEQLDWLIRVQKAFDQNNNDEVTRLYGQGIPGAVEAGLNPFAVAMPRDAAPAQLGPNTSLRDFSLPAVQGSPYQTEGLLPGVAEDDAHPAVRGLRDGHTQTFLGSTALALETIDVDGEADRSLRRIEEILAKAIARDAADVHIQSGSALVARRYGLLERLGDDPLDRDDVEGMVKAITNEEQFAEFKEQGDVSLVWILNKVIRTRVSCFQGLRGPGIVLRIIPSEVPSLDQLLLPRTIARFTSWRQGLLLVNGPAGCGKTSTLAALVNLINEERPLHIITLEDPIEYLHHSALANVVQRQIPKHAQSYAQAPRAALRQDPDIILIGELRDRETVALAMSAAETGHLVMGTLTTPNATATVDRILGLFPPTQHALVCSRLAESLRGVVSQRLLPRLDQTGQVPLLEVLVNTSAVAQLIRQGRTYQLANQIETGRSVGMRTFEDSRKELVKAGLIDARRK